MKLSSRKIERGKKIELSMTSMIDVVFLLLIFFVTTASYIRTERELKPAIKVDKNAPTTVQNFEPAIIEIVRGDTQFVYRIGGRDLTSVEELTEVLQAFPSNIKFDGAFVRVSDEAPFDMAASAISACKDAKFISVSYVPISRN
ncbi:MAG: biopolymer transporter ExbD [Pirellulaceae bacterium]